MSITEWLVAIGLAWFFAALMHAASSHATAVALQPELDRIRSVRKAIAVIGRPTRLYTTRLVLENGVDVWFQAGWQPGHQLGEIITRFGKAYEIAEVHDPVLGIDEREATLIVKPVSQSVSRNLLHPD